MRCEEKDCNSATRAGVQSTTDYVKLQWKISSRIDIRLSEGGVRTICSSTHGNMTCTNRDEVQQVFPHMNEPHSLNHS